MKRFAITLLFLFFALLILTDCTFAENEVQEIEQQQRIMVISMYEHEVAMIAESPKEESFEVKEVQNGEYPEAIYIWDYLQSCGFNNYVCAGIIGNIMVETGGNTLDIIPNAISKEGYTGICQWSIKYFPEARGKNLKEQCEYLISTIEREFITFGNLYKRGFSYNSFKEMSDCRDAALAFAKVYERCNSKSYHSRKECARIAYDYFTKEEI